MSDYAFEGPKWLASTVSWSFAAAGVNFSGAITGGYQATIRAAIARWAEVTNLTFVETPDGATVDIRIGWAKVFGAEIGETDFTYLNDPSKALAFPPGTIVKLQDPAAKPVGTGLHDFYQGTAATLYQTVLHEFGHALGLAHSTNPADIMYPVLGLADPDLGAGDIQGIQLLYGNPSGTGSVTAPIAILPTTVNLASAVIPVYRFFDSRNGTQFLTTSTAERDDIRATRPDLVDEGIAMGGAAPTGDPDAIPVFRFFDTGTGTHFFTSSPSEKAALATTRPDLVLEQATFYEHATAQAGDTAIYRFFEKTDGTHFYTASDAERATILATRADMTFEGVAFYAPKTS